MNIRRALLVFTVLALLPVVTDALIQQQRDQIQVNITINVTPNPLGMVHGPATSGSAIVAKLILNPKEKPRAFHAESMNFSSAVAQAANQGAVRVEASISPNPLGTLLYSNQTGVVFNQEAGTNVTYTCPYTVTVSTTQTAWTLEHGLFTDFAGTAGVFTGHDVLNNTHLQAGTPQPNFTPFIVFSDGQSWVVAAASGLTKTYCVDLEINLPITLAQGAYSSNAVYTLFY
jgi:hypothetical protein